LALTHSIEAEPVNGRIIGHNYIQVAKALEGIKHDAVIDGELVAIGIDGLSISNSSRIHLISDGLRTRRPRVQETISIPARFRTMFRLWVGLGPARAALIALIVVTDKSPPHDGPSGPQPPAGGATSLGPSSGAESSAFLVRGARSSWP
jgi:hypothetical protein